MAQVIEDTNSSSKENKKVEDGPLLPKYHGLDRNRYPKLQSNLVYYHFALFRFFIKLGELNKSMGNYLKLDEKYHFSFNRFVDLHAKLNFVFRHFSWYARCYVMYQSSRDPLQKSLFHLGMESIPYHVELMLIYIKALVDALCNLTPYLYGSDGGKIKRHSFREQREWFLDERNNEYDKRFSEILSKYTNWFITLSGKKHGEGLRDLIIHYNARIAVNTPKIIKPDEPEVDIGLYGCKNPKHNIYPVLKTLVKELFIFFDEYTIHFNNLIADKTSERIMNLENDTLNFAPLHEYADKYSLFPCIVNG